ncbi:hypothetical protein HD554DRAFT_1455644 [Boletus coccyginus]|nr:hypothetical protein HD554DRAFT_1455644 [Boletus coccyginus]
MIEIGSDIPFECVFPTPYCGMLPRRWGNCILVRVSFSSLYFSTTPVLVLSFPHWGVIVIIFAVFLMTYACFEPRSNCHRRGILVPRYTANPTRDSDWLTLTRFQVVLISGFHFAAEYLMTK